MSRIKRASDVPASHAPAHMYVVCFRPYPAAPWGSPFPFADAPTFSTAEEAQAEATCGDNGETRVLRYRLESVGEAVTLPVDVPEPDVCRTCGDRDCDRPEGHEVEEPRTMCDICGRDIEPTREAPLCARCVGTARAAGKQEAARLMVRDADGVLVRITGDHPVARLFAAAPQMLRALELAESALAVSGSLREGEQARVEMALETVRQVLAIARAEGAEVAP